MDKLNPAALSGTKGGINWCTANFLPFLYANYIETTIGFF